LTNPTEPIDQKLLEENAGIGVNVTPEDIERVTEEIIAQNKTKLVEQRYEFPIGTLLGEVRKRLKWADGKAVKAEMDVQVKKFIEIKYTISLFYQIVTRSSWA
jgi:glutaminyl-tRNA synthetase